MTPFSFSPVEQAVLQLLARQWQTRSELVHKAHPASPEEIDLALSYLLRYELAVRLDRPHGEPYFDQTELGAQMLADFLRSRSGLYVEGCHVG
jgi:hypothetical protein